MRIDPVGVVGLGLLGRGIAASLVGAGVHGSPWRPGSADGCCLA
jgi:3-hydroxyisobutyrate dehydrogenase-like beta-hydroxyacid dehydrogenase